MANTSLDVINMDFSSLKASLKAFLQQQNQFADFDFEGSNINVLLDVLSYNTFKNAFYLNMVMSEGFLDSAQLRSSVHSHAKNLNYLPNSKRSAKANVTVAFEGNANSSPYTIAKGSPFTTLVKNTAFTFTVPETITVSSSNNSYEFTTDIYEGLYLTDTFTYDRSQDNPTFKLSNRDIDTTSITVTVYEDGNVNGLTFTIAQTLLGLTPQSKAFFLQPVDNGYYEILFGDGIFGREPVTGATIVVEYRVCNGEAGNGARVFSLDFDPTSIGEMSSFDITLNTAADGGAERQTITSVKRLAPRYFATQQRAVASDDYRSIILAQFAGSISDAAVYGGETLNPPLFGRVVCALKPIGTTSTSDLVKQQVITYLQNYVSIPTRVVVVDPQTTYLNVVSTVQYDTTLSSKAASEIRSLVLSAIQDFSETNLELFGNDFRYSKFINTVDDIDTSIVSNDTEVKMIKRITPLINYQQSYDLEFNNELATSVSGNRTIQSSAFTFQTETGINYTQCYIEDNGSGVLVVYTYINGTYTVLNSILGTVDYTTGELSINKIRVADYLNHISIYARPKSKDILATRADIIVIQSQDCDISIIQKLS